MGGQGWIFLKGASRSSNQIDLRHRSSNWGCTEGAAGSIPALLDGRGMLSANPVRITVITRSDVRNLAKDFTSASGLRLTGRRAVRFSVSLGLLASLFSGLQTIPLRADAPASETPLPIVEKVEAQPLAAQVRRLVEAADLLGIPFSDEDRKALEDAYAQADPARQSDAIQRVIDRHCFAFVSINPEMRVEAIRGPAKPELVQQGWRSFFVKVHNEAGATAALRCLSPEAQSVFGGSRILNESDNEFAKKGGPPPRASDRWLDLQMFNGQPLTPTLSGLSVEYRIVEIYSRDAGKRDATLVFDVGQGTQDLGFRAEVPVLFECKPARVVTCRVLDDRGQPTIGAFLIRDALGRVYPSQAKRLAPDLAFQPQVYRGDGEKLTLPDGTYTVQFSRGPESIPETRTVTIDGRTREIRFQSQRWIDPSQFGWWSGDHHIHAAGCSHYTTPTEGVLPTDMIRYVIGEDVKIGSTLTWGPCFDFQKQFFCGADDNVSKYPYLLRYDIEVSGFGSHRSGHLALLRLKQQIYPGGNSKDHWPTLCLNTLRWAKSQGSVAGFAHSGFGLQVSGTTLPTYEVPPYDGVGANEYIVDVTHELPGPEGKLVPAVDFISMVNTPPVWELNMWYHTLNAGFRTRISGETDFPCVFDDRVGMGRSYVKLDGTLDYDEWCEGIRTGRSYVSDGRSHLMGFAVNGVNMGDKDSEVRLQAAGTIQVTVAVAAKLGGQPDPQLLGIEGPLAEKAIKVKIPVSLPYWSIERARIGSSNEVPVEVIVNGNVVATRKIVADGNLANLRFDIPIATSSWVAIRILPSSHTNPIFVLVNDKPIRASRRSVEWCLKGVDQCWSQKEKFIQASEKEDALRAYDHARETYRRLLTESDID